MGEPQQPWQATTSLVKSPAFYGVNSSRDVKNLSDIWAKEIDLFSTNQDFIKLLIKNKVDWV